MNKMKAWTRPERWPAGKLAECRYTFGPYWSLAYEDTLTCTRPARFVPRSVSYRGWPLGFLQVALQEFQNCLLSRCYFWRDRCGLCRWIPWTLILIDWTSSQKHSARYWYRWDNFVVKKQCCWILPLTSLWTPKCRRHRQHILLIGGPSWLTWCHSGI